tara:strand:+ start:3120 stop:3296 length:177 start_codon:yes stop_codon:yes gene_type:complete
MSGAGPAGQPITKPMTKPKATSGVPVAAAAAQMMIMNGQPPALTSVNANPAAEGKVYA